jgi:hypothetical protein
VSVVAVATAVIQALPWVVIALILVEFTLADELPAPRVRRVAVIAGLMPMAASMTAVMVAPVRTVPEVIGIALGPLTFLVLHAMLRVGFLRLKASEPVLTFTPDSHQGRSTRLWYEPDAPRRVSAWDHVFSMLVGTAMLLSAAPAIAEIIRRS